MHNKLNKLAEDMTATRADMERVLGEIAVIQPRLQTASYETSNAVASARISIRCWMLMVQSWQADIHDGIRARVNAIATDIDTPITTE